MVCYNLSHVTFGSVLKGSCTGAREVITQIRSRQLVTKLILGHNELGDDGCETLFRFLHSPQGRGYPVAEISLNSNGIGDRGLLAISEYLKDNMTLKELFLQNVSYLSSLQYDSKLMLYRMLSPANRRS